MLVQCIHCGKPVERKRDFRTIATCSVCKEILRKETSPRTVRKSKLGKDLLLQIAQMRSEGKLQKEIGKHLGFTSQYISVIERHVIGLPKRGGRFWGKDKIRFFCVCKHCKETFTTSTTSQKEQPFCSRECFFDAHRIGGVPICKTREYNSRRCKSYYHRVLKHRPDWKKITRERNLRQQAKRIIKQKTTLSGGSPTVD